MTNLQKNFLSIIESTDSTLHEEYKNSNTKLKITCSCGHDIYRTPEKTLKSFYSIGDVLCTECAKKIVYERRRADADLIKKELESYGCTDVQDYVSASLKIKSIGTCGHEVNKVIADYRSSFLNTGFIDCNKCAKAKSAKRKSMLLVDELMDLNIDILKRPNRIEEKIKLRCKCGEVFSMRSSDVKLWIKKNKKIQCQKCSRSSTSAAEIDISKLLFYNGLNCRKGKLDGVEFDILIDELKIAIEYDGIFWHSEKILSKKKKHPSSFHLKKTELAYRNGYTLIHVFENEWEGKREIIESMILSKVGKNSKSIFARKTRFTQISSKDARCFFDSNHRQGFSPGKHYGLVDRDGNIVAAMTIAKPRFSKKYDLELVRYANKIFSNVIGGFSKLLRNIEKLNSEKTIVSYADIRYSGIDPDRTVYSKTGFSFSHFTKPGYFYFKGDGKKLLSRVEFQKHKLKDKLEIFDENKTEWENMKDNKYNRIWDCGNMVFVRKFQ